MDGMPLYEYARQGKALPKPIEARSCTIHNLELLSFKKGGEHSWKGAKEEMSAEEKETMLRLERLVSSNVAEPSTAAPDGIEVEAISASAGLDSGNEKQQTNQDPSVPLSTAESPVKDNQDELSASADADTPAVKQKQEQEQESPPAFEIRMTVSSGTYVRSLIHDIGAALGSAAHVVELVRTRQGMYALDPAAARTVEGEDSKEPLRVTVPWSVFEEGIKGLQAKKSKGGKGQKQDSAKETTGDEVDADAVPAWEEAIVKAIG
jgi:tRNA pseudouridine55 synthase